MRPYTTVLPKPLLPVGERPILELIFEWLASSGVQLVDVCTGHLGELIQTYFSQAQTIPAGLNVRWQWEDQALGTAGALRLVPDLEETLLVVNGDIVTDLVLREMLDFHRQAGAVLTIASHQTKVPTDLGVIEHDSGIVTDYLEKPVLEYTASMGVYLYEPEALAALPEGACQFPELVVRLLEQGSRVAVFASDADWHHIGTAAQHSEAAVKIGRLSA
jgi:NDP-sugar pyrophosphorylase family protein